MKKDLLSEFVDEVNFINNTVGMYQNGEESFDYMILVAVANLLKCSTSINEILADIYGELHRMEVGL